MKQIFPYTTYHIVMSHRLRYAQPSDCLGCCAVNRTVQSSSKPEENTIKQQWNNISPSGPGTAPLLPKLFVLLLPVKSAQIQAHTETCGDPTHMAPGRRWRMLFERIAPFYCTSDFPPNFTTYHIHHKRGTTSLSEGGCAAPFPFLLWENHSSGRSVRAKESSYRCCYCSYSNKQSKLLSAHAVVNRNKEEKPRHPWIGALMVARSSLEFMLVPVKHSEVLW